MKITLLTGKTFNISEALGFEIKVITSISAKRITLKVDHKERLPVLTMPKFCSAKKAVEFVKAHLSWLDEQLQKIPERKRFKDSDQICFLGQNLTIKHNLELKSGVYIKDGFMFVSGKPEFTHRRVKDFIKKQTQLELSKQSLIKAEKINCKLNSVVIKDTKSRWGSCSSQNNINYSWRIALAPDYVIDYLIAHEVAHLKHQDHSTNFWKCVKSLCPRYTEGRFWLKTHGKELYLYE